MASWLWGDDTLSLAVVLEAVNSGVNKDSLWVYVMFSSHSEPTDKCVALLAGAFDGEVQLDENQPQRRSRCYH